MSRLPVLLLSLTLTACSGGVYSTDLTKPPSGPSAPIALEGGATYSVVVCTQDTSLIRPWDIHVEGEIRSQNESFPFSGGMDEYLHRYVDLSGEVQDGHPITVVLYRFVPPRPEFYTLTLTDVDITTPFPGRARLMLYRDGPLTKFRHILSEYSILLWSGVVGACFLLFLLHPLWESIRSIRSRS